MDARVQKQNMGFILTLSLQKQGIKLSNNKKKRKKKTTGRHAYRIPKIKTLESFGSFSQNCHRVSKKPTRR